MLVSQSEVTVWDAGSVVLIGGEGMEHVGYHVLLAETHPAMVQLVHAMVQVVQATTRRARESIPALS